MTLLELYDIVNLAEMYVMPTLMDELKIQMEKIPLTMDTLMDVAQTASEFSQFVAVSSSLLVTCAKFLQKSVKPADQLQFAFDQHAKRRGEIALELLRWCWARTCQRFVCVITVERRRV